MADDIFSKCIGNKETKKSLIAKSVVVQGLLAESVMGKADGKNAGKKVGEKLILICKHPDKDELIKISSMVFVNNKTVTTSTIWINTDEDGNIQKGSKLACLLEHYNLQKVSELEGKTLQTEIGDDKYLAIKAY